MGWEFRIFFKPQPGAGSVFPDQHGVHAGTEERTDVYLPHSPAVGIKERGGGIWGDVLEVKLRTHVDELGYEKWTKRIVSGVGKLSDCLTEEGHSAPADDVTNATFVSIAKSRRTGHGNKFITEETELRVTPRTGHGFASGGTKGASSVDGPTETWRTVSVEGNREASSKVRAMLLDACGAVATDGEIFVGGYAEFVVGVSDRFRWEKTKL